MKVLLLGAGGRLGSALVDTLSQKQHQIVAFVRNKANFAPGLSSKCTNVVEGDAKDSQKIEEALRAYGCSAIVNAAGYTPFLPYMHTDHSFIFKSVLVAAEKIGIERSGEGATTVSSTSRVRVWMLSDFALMDCPWPGGLTLNY
jgi:putative NADH-flavin reductase